MVAVVPAKRIDILVDGPLVPRIAAAIGDAGISGHTVLPALGGAGRGDAWSVERLTAAESKVTVMAIASADRAQLLIDALAPLLDSHRLLLTITDVGVVRGDRFV